MRPGRRQTNDAIQASEVANAVEAVAIPFAQRLSCTIAEACEVTGFRTNEALRTDRGGMPRHDDGGHPRLVLVYSLRTLLEKNSQGTRA
jgi:hypothetical protein